MRAPGCPTALMLLGAIGALASTLAATSALAGLPEVVERVKPSVVAVGTFQKTRSPSFVFRGTGFAVGDGTLIATVAHAVFQEAQGDLNRKRGLPAARRKDRCELACDAGRVEPARVNPLGALAIKRLVLR